MVLKANDPDFTLVAENEAHALLVNPDEPSYSVGKAFLEAYPDTSDEFKLTGRNEVIESLRTVIKTGAPDTMSEVRYDLADKHGHYIERWWRATHYPIKDTKGKVTEILQLTQDITQERTDLRRLERTSAQLDLALSIGLVSTYIWDIQKDIVTGDRNLAKNFGVPYDDVQKGLPIQTFIDSIYEDDRERVGDAIQRTVENGGIFEQEYRTYALDGDVRWVLARGTVDRDGEGNPSHFIGILIDITERKNAEIELQTVQRSFDALFNSTVLSIAVADTKGKVYQANKTFLTTFGYTPDDIRKGLLSSDLTPVNSRGVTKKIYGDVETKGESQPVEKEYLRKDGSTFTGLVGAAGIPGTDQLIAFILDVSENKRLQELNAAKDEFIALASHQLRTPATAVKQYLGLILEGYAGDVDETQREYLQVANESNDRELTIVNDLLKTAQIDTNGFKLKPQQVDLIALLNDIIEAYRPICEMKNQQIDFTHDPKLLAHVDANETKVVLTNLIENAHKYSHENTTIHVIARAKAGSAVIEVRDEGVGIAADDINLIFEKFTRVENPLSSVSAGNGLGLYWVKRIVTLHGGQLEVASVIGKGTTFTVQLPL